MLESCPTRTLWRCNDTRHIFHTLTQQRINWNLFGGTKNMIESATLARKGGVLLTRTEPEHPVPVLRCEGLSWDYLVEL